MPSCKVRDHKTKTGQYVLGILQAKLAVSLKSKVFMNKYSEGEFILLVAGIIILKGLPFDSSQFKPGILI